MSVDKRPRLTPPSFGRSIAWLADRHRDPTPINTWLLNAAPRLHRNKLATALANKLARITWSILCNEKTFDLNRHEVMAI
jgi:hypothetical protein